MYLHDGAKCFNDKNINNVRCKSPIIKEKNKMFTRTRTMSFLEKLKDMRKISSDLKMALR